MISEPALIPRPEHNVSRANISNAALKVLYTLKDAGHDGYLVGGGVRDLLLGLKPKDFDVATSATPEEVRSLFKRARLIGRRFRIVHVRFGREIIEVSTFRASPERALEAGEGKALQDDNGRMLRDNVYGTVVEDAWRRDFSVNGLYYSVRDFAIHDYVGGMSDLREGVLRVLGDPETRYREDPVRMLRAVRLSAKLGFRLDEASQEIIPRLAPILDQVPPPRLFDETLKLLLNANAVVTFEKLRAYGLLKPMFPVSEESFRGEDGDQALEFVMRALDNSAGRIGQDKPVSPSFLFGALLWEAVRRRADTLQGEEGIPAIPAIQQAGAEITARQNDTVNIPRRFTAAMNEIWQMQHSLVKRRGQRALRLLEKQRFRAGYDFFCLRAELGQADSEIADWWTRIQQAAPETRTKMAGGTGRRRRRRSRPA